MTTTREERIAVTAVGCVTGLGVDPSALLSAIAAEQSAARLAHPEPIPADLPDAAGETVPMMRMVPIDPAKVGGLKRPFPDRLTVATLHVVDTAIQATNGLFDHMQPDRRALLLCTSMGPAATVEKYLRTLLTQGPERVSAITFPRSVANAVLGEVSRRHQLRGPGTLVMGSHIIGYAIDLLRTGKADAVVCAGADSLGDYTPWAYKREGMLDGGMVLGDGAACVVLERVADAKKRGATVIAEIEAQAIGSCPKAPRRITEIATRSIEQVMQRLIEQSGNRDFDLVFALDNGHEPLAAAERAAITSLLGGSRVVPPKRTIAETFGASEVLSIALAAEALRTRAFGAARRILVNAAHVGGALSATALREHVS
jgi:3-oxoacyl-[acyl-carrier-protein] synthase II